MVRIRRARGHYGAIAAAVIAMMMLFAQVVAGQAVIDGRIVEFTPSAHHNSLASDGTPILTSYEMQVFNAGTTTRVATVALGKPVPQSDGFIRVDFVAFLSAPLPGGVQYEARVAAIGPGGSSVSDVSNQFSFSIACAPVLSSAGTSVGSAATTGSVTVTAAAGCGWTATSNVPWLTVTSGTPGSGSGTVNFSVAANTSTSQRSGSLTVAGLTFTVTQAGAPPCSYSISPTSRTSPSAGETVTVAETAGATCAWTATSNAGWLTVTSGASGTGNGNVTIVVAANTATTQRTGTVTIGDDTFSVTQPGAPCDYSISPTSRTSPSAGETTTVGVTAGSSCPWTATSNTPWLTVTGSASGTGDGSVTITIAANGGTSQRTGTVTIGDETFSVTQPGTPTCAYAISPASVIASRAGQTVSVSETAGAACAWTATSNASWLAVTNGASGTGNGTVTVVVAAYTGTTERTGTVTIGDDAFSVTQPGLTGCSSSISPVSRTSPRAGEVVSVAVTASSTCAWNTTSNATWLAVTNGASGTGNGTVTIVVAQNTGSADRTGTVRIGDDLFTVTQAGTTPCTYAIAPTNRTSVAAGETFTVSVTTGTACTWAVASNVAWMTIGSGQSGTGNGSVSVVVSPNTVTIQRTGTLTIAGNTFTVTQNAAPCTYAVTPTTLNVGASATSGVFTVTTLAGCTWSASGAPAWMIVSTIPRTGSTTLPYSIAANTGPTRTVTLTVAGRSVTVTQAGPPTAPSGVRLTGPGQGNQ